MDFFLFWIGVSVIGYYSDEILHFLSRIVKRISDPEEGIGEIVYDTFGLSVMEFFSILLVIAVLFYLYRKSRPLLSKFITYYATERALREKRRKYANKSSEKTSTLRFKRISFIDLLLLIIKIPLALCLLPFALFFAVVCIITPKELVEISLLEDPLRLILMFYKGIFDTIFED